VDYAQLEVRIAAWLSGDAELLRLFNEGRDPYRETASYILKIKSEDVSKEDRQKGKAAVLGFQYGMGEFAFQRYADETFGVKLTNQEASEFRNMFFSLFPDLLRWHGHQRRIVGRYGKVTSPFGRTRHLERVRSNDRVEVGKAERQAINAPVQGLGGDLTLASMVTLSRTLDNSRALIVGDVHDALLFELDAATWKEDAETILHTFENPPLFDKFGIECPVHLKAEGKVGQFWGEGFEFTLEDLRAGLVPDPFQAA